MLTFLTTILAKIQWYLALAIVCILSGIYLGYHYEAQVYKTYVAQQSVLAQKAKDAAAVIVAHDKEVKDAIDAKDQVDLANYAGYVAELLRKHPSSRPVPAAPAGPKVADATPNGSAVGPIDPAVSCQAGDSSAADHVTLDALIQLQEWRAYARGTGQVN